MGLDLYAGTLTRYYTRNWKTAVQQWAEKNGYKVEMRSADGEPLTQDEALNPAEVQADMEGWRNTVLSFLSKEEEAWPESNDAPYYTDKPDWDALGALLLTAACHTYGEPVPHSVQKNWDFMQHPMIDRLANDEERVWSLFRGTTVWLPLEDCFLFQANMPNGNPAVISTTALLGYELDRINELAWQADEETILSWSQTEGYPADGAYSKNGLISMENFEEHTKFDTDSLTKFAFSMLWQAQRFAKEHKVPVLFDY